MGRNLWRADQLPVVTFLAAVVAVTLLVLVAIGSGVGERDQVREDRYWREIHDHLVYLKGEAERLAIEGNLEGAHAKYREIEKLVGGRHPSSSALWDLAERCKQDQDRIYNILIEAAQAKAAAKGNPERTSAAPAPIDAAALGGALLAMMTQADVVPAPRNPFSPNRPLPASRGGDELDAAVGVAIQKGADFLLGNIEGDQIKLKAPKEETYTAALNALVVYSLLTAGKAVPDERLRPPHPTTRRLLDRLKEHPFLPMESQPSLPITYGRSLRACALAVYARPEDREALAGDVQWLVDGHADGAYTYRESLRREKQSRALERLNEVFASGRSLFYVDPGRDSRTLFHNGEPRVPVRPRPPGSPPPRTILPGMPRVVLRPEGFQPPMLDWDNSNTQYGLLGVWAGAEAGVEVPWDFWAAAEQHWIGCQLPTGEWEYNGKGRQGYYAMTVAGIASLLVVHDYLDGPSLGAGTGRQPYSQPLQRGLAWLEQGDRAVRFGHGAEPQYVGYNLFGLARVGLASGFKYFGTHDWYRELASMVVADQQPDGSWGKDAAEEQAIIETAYMLLFLSRGRAPVMMNKLRFEGSWNNRARDLANLSLFASRDLERQLNWQVVNLERDWSDWLDSPVLYIASHRAPEFKEEDVQKLRAFALGGGLIFTHADASAAPFNTFVTQFAKRLFPEYALADLPQNHEIYSVQYRLSRKPLLRGVSNGSRLLLVHSPTDLSTPWQVRNGTRRDAFEMGVNVFVYAGGKADLRNRLSSPYIAGVPGEAKQTVKLARVKYVGNWDPEPYAWERAGRHVKRHSNINVQSVETNVGGLRAEESPVAHLTGTAAWTAGESDVAAIRNYVQDGGLLLIDSAGGSEAFAKSAADLVAKAFPDKTLTVLPADQALMHDLPRLDLRPFAEAKLGKAGAKLSVLDSGKGAVIVTPLDLTTGMIGSNTWGISGFAPATSLAVARNLVIYAAGGKKD